MRLEFEPRPKWLEAALPERELLIMASLRGSAEKRHIFQASSIWKRRESKYIKMVGTFVILDCKGTQKSKQMHFMATSNLPGLVINSEVNVSAFTAVLRNAAFF